MGVIFVLGCERSGSTWLANILDAHPEVELFMEPFADYARLFPGVPLRAPAPGPTDAQLVDSVRSGVERLARHKHPLLYRRGRSPALERVDRRLASGIRRASLRLGADVPLWVQRYELLNLHAREVPAELRVRKTRRPSRRVVKELRLGYAVEILSRAFPDARFVVVLRHPVAQVASMSRWIERGHLRELARHIPVFLHALESPGPLRAYASITGGRDPFTAALTAYWIASHSALLRDLRERGRSHLVLRHEELSRTPDAGVAALLRFCGLDAAPEVARYVAASTRVEAGDPSPLDTRRASHTLVERANAAASPDLRRCVLGVVDAAAKEGLLDSGLETWIRERPLLSSARQGS